MSEHTTANAGFKYYDDGDNAAAGVNWNTGYNSNWNQLDKMAGDGLAWDSSTPKKLAVQVDGSTIEISGDSLRVKDGLPLSSAVIGQVSGGSTAGASLTLESTTHATKGSIILASGGGNVGIGASSFGTSADKVLAIGSGTAPTTAPANTVQLWSEDINGTAGKAGLHMMAESGTSKLVVVGTIIKSTTGDPSLVHEGLMCINTADKTLKMYCGGAWRSLATW